MGGLITLDSLLKHSGSWVALLRRSQGQQAPLSHEDVWKFIEYRERPIFTTAKEPHMTDLTKTAGEQALRISKEDAHSIKQALLSAASLSASACATNPQEAAKCLALAFAFLDEVTGSRPAVGGTA